MRSECAICNRNIKHIHSLEKMPIKLCCTDSPEINNAELSFSQCDECGTIQLDKLIPLDILYSNSHNYTSVGKVWENYFNLFCESINDLIIDKNILEIGDPSGKIANRMDNYKKWHIIEPNKNKKIEFKEKIEFIESFFDENFQTDKQIDMIVHSHLFEHIYDPNVFLKKCHEILVDDGEMFFGVPNMEYIGKNELAPFAGIFFEHTILLNKENITYLLNKNGFTILRIIDYENHSILFHAKKSPTFLTDFASSDNSIVNCELFLSSVTNYKKFIEKCIRTIEENPNKKVYVFGASYNTQFLLSMGLNPEMITGILDNSVDKQNKYLYGYNLKIYSPEIIRNKEDCIVILKNGYYNNEIMNQLLLLNDKIVIVK